MRVFTVLIWAPVNALKVETIPGARQIYHWDGFLAHVFGIKITSAIMYLLLFLINRAGGNAAHDFAPSNHTALHGSAVQHAGRSVAGRRSVLF